MRAIAFLCLLIPVPALAQDAQFSWSLTNADGVELANVTEAAPRARVDWAQPHAWAMTAGNDRLSIAFRLEEPTGEVDELNRNNTSVRFLNPVSGHEIRVRCTVPERDQIAVLTRTVLDDSRVAGEFEVQLTHCIESEMANPIEVEGLPYTLTGRVDLPLD